MKQRALATLRLLHHPSSFSALPKETGSDKTIGRPDHVGTAIAWLPRVAKEAAHVMARMAGDRHDKGRPASVRCRVSNPSSSSREPCRYRRAVPAACPPGHGTPWMRDFLECWSLSVLAHHERAVKEDRVSLQQGRGMRCSSADRQHREVGGHSCCQARLQYQEMHVSSVLPNSTLPVAPSCALPARMRTLHASSLGGPRRPALVGNTGCPSRPGCWEFQELCYALCYFL